MTKNKRYPPRKPVGPTLQFGESWDPKLFVAYIIMLILCWLVTFALIAFGALSKGM